MNWRIFFVLLPALVLLACAEDDDDASAEPCGALPDAGCCDGETLVFCEDGELARYDCANYDPPVCGWDQANSWYDCAHDDELPADAGVSPACP